MEFESAIIRKRILSCIQRTSPECSGEIEFIDGKRQGTKLVHQISESQLYKNYHQAYNLLPIHYKCFIPNCPASIKLSEDGSSVIEIAFSHNHPSQSETIRNLKTWTRIREACANPALSKFSIKDVYQSLLDESRSVPKELQFHRIQRTLYRIREKAFGHNTDVSEESEEEQNIPRKRVKLAVIDESSSDASDDEDRSTESNVFPIPNEIKDSGKFENIDGRRLGSKLIHDIQESQLYKFKYQIPGSYVHYVCYVPKCPAAINLKQDGSYFLKKKSSHNHSSQKETINTLKTLTRLKEACTDPFQYTSSVREVYESVVDISRDLPDELKFNRICRSLFRIREKAFGNSAEMSVEDDRPEEKNSVPKKRGRKTKTCRQAGTPFMSHDRKEEEYSPCTPSPSNRQKIKVEETSRDYIADTLPINEEEGSFDYIEPSEFHSTSISDQFEYMDGKRQGSRLIHDIQESQLYKFSYQFLGNYTHYKCYVPKCPASMNLKEDGTSSAKGKSSHNHPSQKETIRNLKLLSKIKKGCADPDMYHLSVREVYKTLVDESKKLPEGLKFNRINRSLFRIREKAFGSSQDEGKELDNCTEPTNRATSIQRSSKNDPETSSTNKATSIQRSSKNDQETSSTRGSSSGLPQETTERKSASRTSCPSDFEEPLSADIKIEEESSNTNISSPIPFLPPRDSFVRMESNEFEYIDGKRQGSRLIHEIQESQLYRVNYNYPGKYTHYRCYVPKCPASINVDIEGKRFIRGNPSHNHTQSQSSTISLLKIMIKLKEACADPALSHCKIRDIYNTFVNEDQLVPKELEYNRISRSLYRIRDKALSQRSGEEEQLNATTSDRDGYDLLGLSLEEGDADGHSTFEHMSDHSNVMVKEEPSISEEYSSDFVEGSRVIYTVKECLPVKSEPEEEPQATIVKEEPFDDWVSLPVASEVQQAIVKEEPVDEYTHCDNDVGDQATEDQQTIVKEELEIDSDAETPITDESCMSNEFVEPQSVGVKQIPPKRDFLDETSSQQLFFEFIEGRRKTGRLVHTLEEDQLYRLKSRYDNCSYYTCYVNTCKVSIKVKDDVNFCTLTIQKKHNHEPQSDVIREIKLVAEIKAQCEDPARCDESVKEVLRKYDTGDPKDQAIFARIERNLLRIKKNVNDSLTLESSF